MNGGWIGTRWDEKVTMSQVSGESISHFFVHICYVRKKENSKSASFNTNFLLLFVYMFKRCGSAFILSLARYNACAVFGCQSDHGLIAPVP